MTGGAKNLTVTGHSRGGGEGDVAIRRFLKEHPDTFDSAKAVLFGSPCVCRKRFLKAHPVPDGTVIYVDNGDDIVTRLPPKRIFGYHREGHVIEIGHQLTKSQLRRGVLRAMFLGDFSVVDELNDHKRYGESLRHYEGGNDES